MLKLANTAFKSIQYKDMQDENQQSNLQPNSTSNDPVDLTTPQGAIDQPVAMVNGQSTVPSPVQTSDEATGSSMKPSGLGRIIKFALIAIVTIPVIAIVGFIIVFAVSGQVKMTKLQHAADNKLEKLEKMLAIENKVTDARGGVDGDALTANSDPARSTSAYLSFENKTSLQEIEAKLAEAMGKEGFKRDGGDTSPYYKTTSPAYSGGRLDNINRVQMRYSNGQDAIKITYELDKYYACPKEYTCERTEKTKPSEKIYDIRSYASLPVIKVSINYANKNYYQTQL